MYDKDNKQYGIAAWTLAVILFAMVLVGVVIEGWVFTILWKWFVVEFFSLPPLPLVVAIGISIIVGMLTSQMVYAPKDISIKERINALVSYVLVRPLILLAFGWFVHLFK